MNFEQPPQPPRTLETLNALLGSVEERRTAAIEHIKEKGAGDSESVRLVSEWREPLEKEIQETSVPIERRLATMRLDIETAVLYAQAGMLKDALEMMDAALRAPKQPEDDVRFDRIYEEILALEDDLQRALYPTMLEQQSEGEREE